MHVFRTSLKKHHFVKGTARKFFLIDALVRFRVQRYCWKEAGDRMELCLTSQKSFSCEEGLLILIHCTAFWQGCFGFKFTARVELVYDGNQKIECEIKENIKMNNIYST